MNRRLTPLVPEIACGNAVQSLSFYTAVLEFEVLFSRPAQGFYYLSHHGAELMLEQVTDDSWIAGGDAPLGRGIHLQIMTPDVVHLYSGCQAADATIYRALEEAWYRTDAGFEGQRQFVVLDPDGYMLRFAQDLGLRDTPPETGRTVP